MKMYYVYILQSERDPREVYTGYTEDLRQRLTQHNLRQNKSSAEFAPWKLKCYVAFDDKTAAEKYERYLKTGSGRAVIYKRFGLVNYNV